VTKRSSVLALGVVLLLVVPVRASAQQVQRTCQFIRDFKRLHDLAPAQVGTCLSRRIFAPGGDVLQYTTNGLMVRRKSDNWTAFTDGHTTWIDGPRGLVSRPNSERFPWERDSRPPEVWPEPTERLGPASAYPNPALTPGATDPRVSQRNIRRTICSDDYLARAKPSPVYTERVMRLQLRRYGYAEVDAGNYELDHFVPIELGGDADAPSNMWPQPYAPAPGAGDKDRAEAFLHEQVCTGAMTLAGAQQAILNDWVAVYQQLPVDIAMR